MFHRGRPTEGFSQLRLRDQGQLHAELAGDRMPAAALYAGEMAKTPRIQSRWVDQVEVHITNAIQGSSGRAITDIVLTKYSFPTEAQRTETQKMTKGISMLLTIDIGTLTAIDPDEGDPINDNAHLVFRL